MRPGLAVALAFAFAALVGGVGFLGARLVFAPAPLVAPDSVWRDAAWPFLRDGWPAGRALRCDAARCGEEILVYARVKAGMCDCVAGVADDEDLERVSDAALISPRLTPEGAGGELGFAGLKGRLQPPAPVAGPTRRPQTLDHPDQPGLCDGRPTQQRPGFAAARLLGGCV
jgi:hypothetical protein